MRILLVDDHAVVRKGVMDVLSAMEPPPVFAEAGTSAEAEARLAAAPGGFDLVVLDLSLPDGSGLETLARIRARAPDLPVVILSMYADARYAMRAFQGGANAYVTKSSAPEELQRAIEQVMEGRTFASGNLVGDLLAAMRPGGASSREVALSERENLVLQRLARGARITAIAAELGLSPKTVATYRARILEKLDLDNNAQLVRYALDNGLVEE